MDSKFDCENYGPNTGTTQILMGRDNIEFFRKSGYFLMKFENTLNIEVVVDKLSFLE